MRLIFLLLFFSCWQSLVAQTRGDIRLMFYNVENLFDTEDDPRTNDEEFTPYGNRHWNKDKYTRKLQSIYKVIAGVGGWHAPELVGMAEVENRRVLTDLIKTTPLNKVAYQIVHFDSPDPRGIDVALLFRADKLKLVKQASINITFKNDPDRKTRNILYAQFFVNKDTLNVFVNHWPSRRGGDTKTEPLRIQVANILRHKVDSLFRLNTQSKIVIMGDFNDEPEDVSITKYLKASEPINTIMSKNLYNFSAVLMKTAPVGTHSFRGRWGILDHVIVSSGLISSKSGLFTKPSYSYIFSPEYLLYTDKRNLTQKPFSTYSGPRYLGGFSDHLPVYLDLFYKK